MRDVLSGDFLTAVTRLAEVLIVAMAIAVGVAIPITAVRIFTGILV
jgi:cation transport ATPase